MSAVSASEGLARAYNKGHADGVAAKAAINPYNAERNRACWSQGYADGRAAADRLPRRRAGASAEARA